MMLRTGNNLGSGFWVLGYGFVSTENLEPKTYNRKPHNGFTLVEVMVAASVLALGAVLLYESFFISLSGFNYYSNYLKVASFMDEKIWEVQDSLTRLGTNEGIETEGEFSFNNKEFKWALGCALVDDQAMVYNIDLSVSWKEGVKARSFKRTAYAMYIKRE